MITESKADKPSLHRSVVILTNPSEYPITVEEMKEFSKIDGNEEDDIIEGFIASVTNLVEDYLRRSLVTRTYKMKLDKWEFREIELPYPPLLSIQSVNTLDEDGTETEYDSDNYYTVTESIPGKIVIKKNSSLPINSERDTGGYEINYTAGYGSASDIPKQIKLAIKQWCAMIYDKRSMTDENELFKSMVPVEVKKILRMYKVERI